MPVGQIDIDFMKVAIDEARKSLDSDDVPIGAVIVRNGEVIAAEHNRVEETGDSTAHAELLAIKKAIGLSDYKHLIDCKMYVTLEPCSMCSGAIVLARIPRLFFGADDPKAGASGSLYEITSDPRLNHRCEITRGLMQKECSEMLKFFFKKLRNK